MRAGRVTFFLYSVHQPGEKGIAALDSLSPTWSLFLLMCASFRRLSVLIILALTVSANMLAAADL